MLYSEKMTIEDAFRQIEIRIDVPIFKILSSKKLYISNTDNFMPNLAIFRSFGWFQMLDFTKDPSCLYGDRRHMLFQQTMWLYFMIIINAHWFQKIIVYNFWILPSKHFLWVFFVIQFVLDHVPDINHCKIKKQNNNYKMLCLIH